MLQSEVVGACKLMVERYQAEAVQVDPSAAGLIAEMESEGLPANAADNTVVDGIQGVKARLAIAGDGKPRLTMSNACANTIGEFESYAWRERSGNMLDEPEKINDHAMDALRYTLRYLDGNTNWWITY
jgi:phage terminase large subunit